MAAIHLTLIIAFWLVAWVPMAIYCLIASVVSLLINPKSQPYPGA